MKMIELFVVFHFVSLQFFFFQIFSRCCSFGRLHCELRSYLCFFWYSLALHACAINLRICFNWIYYKVSRQRNSKLHNRRACSGTQERRMWFGAHIRWRRLGVYFFFFSLLFIYSASENDNISCCDAKLNWIDVMCHTFAFTLPMYLFLWDRKC